MATLLDVSAGRNLAPSAKGPRSDRIRPRSVYPALRDWLIEKHLMLVKRAVARIAGRLPSHLGLDDLCSSGVLGLITAAEGFDPERGVEFRAYATGRIRGAILDELRRLDPVPRTVRRRRREAERAIDSLFQRLGRRPTDEEIAGELGIDVEGYRRLLGDGVALCSLDAPSTQKDDAAAPVDTLMDILEDAASPNPFLSLAAKEGQTILLRMVDSLPRRQRHALALYYYGELTMQEVAQVMGISESRVSQLHSSAVLHLRAGLRRKRLGAGDLVFPVSPENGALPVVLPRDGKGGRVTERAPCKRRSQPQAS
ncbi:MAG: FliA/WhiG family RNA polymerase sigma factor [Candidatus Methylomirabilia bacterium]